MVEVQGSDRVFVMYRRDPNVLVELAEAFGASFEGIIILRLNISKFSVIDYDLSFYSISPYNLTISKISTTDGKRVIASYACPAGVTLRLIMELTATPASGIREPSMSSIPASFWLIDPWKLLVYCFFISLFGATAFLDLKDMKRKKAGRWSLNDSIALILRYMFYAFLLSFVAITILTFGMFIYSSLTAFSLELKLGGLLTSLIMFLIIAIIYGLARWRGWYELIDEED
ncbi:MAG: hypothetical protein N3F04_07030 [Candidatus Nezhaarchaeota archaeon]|nr:hypothetical protein [Candidatus Nezhaarchaeota archaeon]MCX8142496.1 hypothetical protein [Candidatus Nezhaarchaeota archaeon]MDW8050531.1 hypothetical protein [Nitrososphaerota archaeon]